MPQTPQTRIEVEHRCWWTRRRETELSERDGGVYGAGVPTPVLETTARLLGTALSVRPSSVGEYEEDVMLGKVAGGTIHDGCFLRLEPVSMDLKRALLDATLTLHSTYLGCDVDWSRVRPALLDSLTADVVLRIRAFPASDRITVRQYEARAGWLARVFAKAVQINCSSGVAVFT